MARLYSIRDWDSHFEVAQSKRSERTRWVAIPNKHDGKSFRRLMRMKNGMALYGAWILIVQVASKCPVRGRLEDDDGPLTAADIADKASADEKIVQAALDACSSKAIGWIDFEEVNSERTPSALRVRSECAQQKLSTEQNKTEQDKTEQHIADGEVEGDGQPPRQPSEPSKKFDPRLIALPAELDAPQFRTAWGEWVDFRGKLRKPISEPAAKKQLSQLIRYGPDGAAESINQSIANDWQGLFEPKRNGQQQQGKFKGIQAFLEKRRDGNGICEGDGVSGRVPGS